MRSLWRRWGAAMKTLKAELAGTGKVFRFSLQQYFKSAATYIMLAFMLLGTGGSMLMMSLGMNRGESMGSEAKTLYIRNESPWSLELAALPDYVEARETDRPLAELLEQLDAGETDGVVVELAAAEDGTWRATGYTGEKTGVTQQEAMNLAACCAGLAEEARYAALGISPQQTAVALAPVSVDVMRESTYREPDEKSMGTRQIAGSAYSILIFMLISFTTSFIVRAVVQEKSSRLVEVLMISVRPLALITGKILGAMCLVVAGVLCAGLGLALTRLVLGLLGMDAGGEATAGLGALLGSLNAGGVLVVLVSVVLGYVSYSIVAGVSGACCSTESETENASSAAMLIAMVGYMAGMISAVFKAGTAVKVLSVIPFVSVFIAPARFLMGDIPLWLLGLGWLLQAAVAFLLMRACAAVYGALLIHRGEKIGLGQVLRMLKGGEKA